MKNKLATILIITITAVLAGIAIFTAVRLYQLRNQSVSPNAPESQPAAKGVECSLASATSCHGKYAGDPCNDGLKCFALTNQKDKWGRPNCRCGPPTGNESGTPTPTAPPNSGACSLTFTLAGSTAPPTGTPEETSTPTPTTTPTSSPGAPNSCNGTCGSNANCNSNLICSNGFCRNPSCKDSESCACPGGGSTPAPTAPTLPQSGTDWPTIFGASLGVFVIIGSMLLAL